MTGVIQSMRHDPSSGVATIVVLDEFGDVSLVHADGGPLFHAILEGKLRVGDVIKHATILIGTMPMMAVAGEGDRS